MKKRGRKEGLLVFFVFILAILSCFLIRAENSESPTEWRMYGKYLNHTGWDGTDFTVISGLNYSYFHASDYIGYSHPAISNGYIYVIDGDAYIYQLNASNVSQQVANFTAASPSMEHSPAIAYGYVYADVGEWFYQLNASNISQQIANFTAGSNPFGSYPIVAYGYVYIGHIGNPSRLYQLNASNISQQITNYSISGSGAQSLSVANGFIYVGTVSVPPVVMQLNASNISQWIANFSYGGTDFFTIPSAVYNGSLYISNEVNDNQAYMFQLNASNISQQFANFSLGTQFHGISPAIANGYLYIGGGAGSAYVNHSSYIYQLNVSNISQQIANYSPNYSAVTSVTIAAETSAIVAQGSVYIGASDAYMYQLNASNISQLIGKVYVGGNVYSPAYAKGYLYFGSGNYNFYQVNASNLSLFTITDTIPPNVFLTANLNVNMPGEMNLNLWLNEPGYCEYSFDAGKTNNTFGYYHPTAYLFYQYFPSLASGGYTIHAYCNDTSGNRNDTATVSFTITYPGEEPGPPSTTTGTTSVSSVSAGEPTTAKITNPNIEVREVTITTTENVSSVSITVQEVPRARVADFEIGISTRQVYQALNITTRGLNNNQIETATITFRVNKSWVEEQRRATEEDVLLFRRNDTTRRWQALNTTYLYNDSQFYYYTAITPGFSTFVIYFGRYECEPGINRCFENQIQMCLGNATWLITEKCQYGCDEQGACLETPLQSKNFYTFLIVAVGVAAVIVLYLLAARVFRKKKKRR